MSRKTERAYTALFNKILSVVPEWQPQVIIVDFERAAIAAIRTIFPYTTIRGCWFHSSQAVWRKVANIGKLTLKSKLPFSLINKMYSRLITLVNI